MSTNTAPEAGLANALDTVAWRGGEADDPLLPRLMHVEFPIGSAQEYVEHRAQIIDQHQRELEPAQKRAGKLLPPLIAIKVLALAGGVTTLFTSWPLLLGLVLLVAVFPLALWASIRVMSPADAIKKHMRESLGALRRERVGSRWVRHGWMRHDEFASPAVKNAMDRVTPEVRDDLVEALLDGERGAGEAGEVLGALLGEEVFREERREAAMKGERDRARRARVNAIVAKAEPEAV